MPTIDCIRHCRGYLFGRSILLGGDGQLSAARVDLRFHIRSLERNVEPTAVDTVVWIRNDPVRIVDGRGPQFHLRGLMPLICGIVPPMIVEIRSFQPAAIDPIAGVIGTSRQLLEAATAKLLRIRVADVTVTPAIRAGNASTFAIELF